jgi:hypothetical protein
MLSRRNAVCRCLFHALRRGLLLDGTCRQSRMQILLEPGCYYYKWITMCIGFELSDITDMRGLLCLRQRARDRYRGLA